METEKATIDISEHIESATKSYLKDNGKVLIEKAIGEYFDGQRFYSTRQTQELLNVSAPTLRSWKRRKLITPIIVGGRECYTASKIDQVKSANMRYKRDV